jgi:hypothetical protein
MFRHTLCRTEQEDAPAGFLPDRDQATDLIPPPVPAADGSNPSPPTPMPSGRFNAERLRMRELSVVLRGHVNSD